MVFLQERSCVGSDFGDFESCLLKQSFPERPFPASDLLLSLADMQPAEKQNYKGNRSSKFSGSGVVLV